MSRIHNAKAPTFFNIFSQFFFLAVTQLNSLFDLGFQKFLAKNLKKFGQKFLEAQIKNAASYLDREFSCVTA